VLHRSLKVITHIFDFNAPALVFSFKCRNSFAYTIHLASDVSDRLFGLVMPLHVIFSLLNKLVKLFLNIPIDFHRSVISLITAFRLIENLHIIYIFLSYSKLTLIFVTVARGHFCISRSSPVLECH